MPSVLALTVLIFVVSFSFNFTNSAVLMGLSTVFAKRPGPPLNFVSAMYGLGCFFIPLAAEGCRRFFDTKLAVFYALASLALAAAAPYIFISSPDRVVRAASPTRARHHASRSLELLTICAAIAVMFFIYMIETGVGNWIYTFASKEANLTDAQAALANSTYWGAFTLGRVLAAAISHVTTPLTLLLGSLLISLVGAALPLIVGRAHLSRRVVMAMATLTGMGKAVGYANTLAMLAAYVPLTGIITGWFGVGVGAGIAVGPALMAAIAKRTNLRYMSVPWVALVTDGLQLLAILVTVVAGRKLLSLPLAPESEALLKAEGDTEEEAEAEAEADEGRVIVVEGGAGGSGH